MIKMEDLMGMFQVLLTVHLQPLSSQLEAMPNKRNPANLTSYMKSKYLLMSPYLEGSKFEKILGDTGEISADWREKSKGLQELWMPCNISHC